MTPSFRGGCTWVGGSESRSPRTKKVRKNERTSVSDDPK